jgi:ketosteroid isomerase-like protein
MIRSRYLNSVLVVALITYSGQAPAQPSSDADTAGDEAGIRSTLASYNDALDGGKTAEVLPLYTDEGVFMPPYSQSAVGEAAVEKAYDAVFRELKFNVKFTIAELVVIAPIWAYARTNSEGTTSFDGQIHGGGKPRTLHLTASRRQIHAGNSNQQRCRYGQLSSLVEVAYYSTPARKRCGIGQYSSCRGRVRRTSQVSHMTSELRAGIGSTESGWMPSIGQQVSIPLLARRSAAYTEATEAKAMRAIAALKAFRERSGVKTTI